MERRKISENYNLDEVIDPVTYFTEDDQGLSKIDLTLIPIVQLLRSLYGKAIPINNWWKYAIEHGIDSNSSLEDLIKFSNWIDKQKHVNQWSGFRSKRCKIGAEYSTHKLGEALDPKGNTQDLYNIVKENVKLFYDFGLRQIEDPKITNGWLHISTSLRHFNKGKIRVIGRSEHAYDLSIN